MDMKLSFRWYGKDDPVTLKNISQIPGMRSIVSAVYDVKPGEVWPMESLIAIKEECEKHNLVFDVVESIPVHEDIKLGRGNVDGRANALGGGKRIGNGIDQVICPHGHALLHHRAETADEVDAEFFGGAVECLRKHDKILA